MCSQSHVQPVCSPPQYGIIQVRAARTFPVTYKAYGLDPDVGSIVQKPENHIPGHSLFIICLKLSIAIHTPVCASSCQSTINGYRRNSFAIEPSLDPVLVPIELVPVKYRFLFQFSFNFHIYFSL